MLYLVDTDYNEWACLNRRIAAIQESIHKDGSRQARLEEIQSIIAKRSANETQYDDSIVRQMIECIKVSRCSYGRSWLFVRWMNHFVRCLLK